MAAILPLDPGSRHTAAACHAVRGYVKPIDDLARIDDRSRIDDGALGYPQPVIPGPMQRGNSEIHNPSIRFESLVGYGSRARIANGTADLQPCVPGRRRAWGTAYMTSPA